MAELFRNNRWKGYLPALILFLVGWLFFAIPMLAAILLSGACVTGALVYASIVYRVHKFRDAVNNAGAQGSGDETIVGEVISRGGPNIRTVSATILGRSPHNRWQH